MQAHQHAAIKGFGCSILICCERGSSNLSLKPLLALDGQETEFGRALFCISSLYWADWAHTVRIRFLDVRNPDVSIALDALRWDLGFEIEISSHADGLEEAALYAGICFRSAAHMRFAHARRWGVPVVLALQYPDREWISASSLLHQEFAFDPKRFADHLSHIVAALS